MNEAYSVLVAIAVHFCTYVGRVQETASERRAQNMTTENQAQ
jgi:hypothetical protein